MNDNTNVRTTTEDGTPLFCGKDIASILGYKDTTNALKLHCRGVVKHHPIVDSLGRSQSARFITEPDLYRLIIRSDKPEAKAFRRWVTSEVLPSIRKRGGYLTPEATREALRDPDFIIQLAMDLKEERARAAQAEAARAQAEAEVEAQRPVAAPRHTCRTDLLRWHPERITHKEGATPTTVSPLPSCLKQTAPHDAQTP